MNRFLYLSILAGVYLESVSPVLAVDTTKSTFSIVQPPGTGPMVKGDTSTVLSTLMTNAITTIFVISAIAIVVMVLWGAFEWIASGGNKEKLGAAQKRITTALIGAAVLALSFVVLKVLGEVLQ